MFELTVPTLHEKDIRKFYHNLTFLDDALYMITQVNKVNIALNEQVFGLPTEGTRSLKDESGSGKFLKVCGKLDDLNIKNMIKKSFKENFISYLS